MTRAQAYKKARRDCRMVVPESWNLKARSSELVSLSTWEKGCRKLTVWGGKRPKKVAAYLIEGTPERFQWERAMEDIDTEVDEAWAVLSREDG